MSDPHRLLHGFGIERRFEGIFEDDVVAWVAAVEFGLDFGVEVVVTVLGFPVAARHAEGVADGAVGPVAQGSVELVDKGELVAVVAAVGVEAESEGATDVLLVVGAAVVYKALLLGVIAVYVGVGEHIWTMIHRWHRPLSQSISLKAQVSIWSNNPDVVLASRVMILLLQKR